MADHNVNRAKSAQLTAGVVDNVTLACNTKSIEIINRDATNPISFTVGPALSNTADPRYPAAPTSLGDNCLVVPPGRSMVVRWPGVAGPAALVRIIGPAATTPAYTVQGIDPTTA